MLIYEKNNKLNINFDNEVSENPDLQIGKSGDKTEVLIDGQPGGSGSGVEPVIVTLTQTSETDGTWSGATWEELVNAYYHGCAFAVDDVNSVAPINGSLTTQGDTAIEMEFSNIFVGDGVTMVTVTLSNDKSVFVNRSQYQV